MKNFFIVSAVFAFGVLSSKLLPDFYQGNNATRSISSIKANETSISKEAHSYIKQMEGIENVHHMQKFVDTHLGIISKAHSENNLEELPEDYRLMTSLLFPVSKLRGSFYRAYGLTKKEKIDRTGPKKKYVQSYRKRRKKYNRTVVKHVIDSKFQNISALIETYLPITGDTIFAWLTEPHNGEKQDFEYMENIQDFIMSSVYPELAKSIDVINSITSVSMNNPIILDSAMFTSNKHALPQENRYISIYPHSLSHIKRSLHNIAHSMIIYSQYNRNDYINFQFKTKGKIFNPVKQFFSPGLTMKDIVESYKSFPDLLKIRTIPTQAPKEHGTWMMTAYDHLVKSDKFAVEASVEIKKADKLLTTEEKRRTFFDPRLSFIYSEKSQEVMAHREKVVTENGVKLRNWTNGKFITVNYPKFYQNPPKDLKVFLPTGHKNSDKYRKVAGKKIVNYKNGVATKWNTGAWKEYFPSVNSNDDVKEVAKTLLVNPTPSKMSMVVNRFISVAVGYRTLQL